MTCALVALPGNEAFTATLAKALGTEVLKVTWHRFPDGETNLRFDTSPAGRSIAIVATLDRPDAKLLPLAFCAATARDLGAPRVGLVAPYLCYMRQDRRFVAGEGITAHYFPRMIAQWFDWMVTADPHLHRIHDLSEVYPIPTRVVHCAEATGRWINAHIDRPLIVGPDEESAQWADVIAQTAGAPAIVLRKTRHGDKAVTIEIPDLSEWAGYQPVLVDDIVSSGHSMVETIRGLRAQGLADPWCVAVHAVFAGSAEAEIRAAGIAGLATCNTIVHPTNAIDVAGLFIDPVRNLV